jgi:hypothetical protein
MLMAKCPNCGVENPDDSRFCIGCGNAIAAGKDASGSNVQVAAPRYPRIEILRWMRGRIPVQGMTVKQICTSCGVENEPGGKFCTGCGKDLQGPSSEETAAAPQGAIGPPFQRFLGAIDDKMKAASFDKIDVPPLLNLDRSFRRQKLELSKIGHVTTFCGIKCLNEPATAALYNHSARMCLTTL